MSEKVNLGWLTDQTGTKFAPKTVDTEVLIGNENSTLREKLVDYKAAIVNNQDNINYFIDGNQAVKKAKQLVDGENAPYNVGKSYKPTYFVDGIPVECGERLSIVAAEATALTNHQKMLVDLESDKYASFNGTKDVTLGIQGVLQPVNGGIGNSNGRIQIGHINTDGDVNPTATAEGVEVQALGETSHAEGIRTVAEGRASHVEGVETSVISEWGGHAEGFQTLINTPQYAHAEGMFTHISKNNETLPNTTKVSMEDGKTFDHCILHYDNPVSYTDANGKLHTTDIYSYFNSIETMDSGDAAHAEGYGTIASGKAAHAEGILTRALGLGSHASGFGTVASHGQTVIGKLNKIDEPFFDDNNEPISKYAFIVGGGQINFKPQEEGSTDPKEIEEVIPYNRYNIFTVGWDGRIQAPNDYIINIPTKKATTELGAMSDDDKGGCIKNGYVSKGLVFLDQYADNPEPSTHRLGMLQTRVTTRKTQIEEDNTETVLTPGSITTQMVSYQPLSTEGYASLCNTIDENGIIKIGVEYWPEGEEKKQYHSIWTNEEISLPYTPTCLAEMRESEKKISEEDAKLPKEEFPVEFSAGTVVCENDSGKIKLANNTADMISNNIYTYINDAPKNCYVIADTVGYYFGENKNNFYPVATNGRVLVNYDTTLEINESEENKTLEYYYPKGAPVYASKNGTVRAVAVDTDDIPYSYFSKIIGYVTEWPSVVEIKGEPNPETGEIPTTKIIDDNILWNGVKVGKRIVIKLI